MSTAVVPVVETVDPPEVVREKAEVDRTMRLQIEYRKKLRHFARQHDEVTRQRAELEADQRSLLHRNKLDRFQSILFRLIDQSRPLVVATQELVQYASGLIENARLPKVDKLELKLRNAELEAELIHVRELGY